MNTKESQLDQFKDAAKNLGADESEDALDRIMGKLDLKKKLDAMPPPTGRQSSDKQR